MFLCEKTTKCEEKTQTKSAKTVISGIFPVFSAGKNFFSKIGLSHVLSIVNMHLCAKNQKKQMIKSRENAKKPVFPAYFRHFWPKIFFFQKSGSVTFLALPFCIFVPNFMKKYQVQLEIFKKDCFSGENWLFRRFLDSSGFKNKFL